MKAYDKTPRSASSYARYLIAAVLVSAPLFGQDEDETESADAQNYKNYIVVGASGIELDGSNAAWSARTHQTSNLQGGIESLHFESPLNHGWQMELDGRGILHENDYSVEILFDKPDFNQTRFGFETFRIWSDATTVAIPDNDIIKVFDPALALDRSKFFVESIFTPDDAHTYTLRYTLRTREGEKASTSWAYATINGDSSARRKISPSFWDLDEEHHTVELQFDYDLERTDWSTGLRWDRIEYDNAFRYVDYPEGANTGRTTEYTANERDIENDTISAHATVQHKVSEQFTVNASGMYSRLEGNAMETRIRRANSFYPTLATGELYHEVDADFDWEQYIVTFSGLYTPAENWVVTPSLRTEKTQNKAAALVDATNSPQPTNSENEFTMITAQLGARYNGFQNWTLYGDILGSHATGNLDEIGGSSFIQRSTEYDRDMAKLTLGANWYAHRKVTVAFQANQKIAKNDYDHEYDNNLDTYPAFIDRHEREATNFNVRVNWRLHPGLTSVTRFDYRMSTIHTSSIIDPLIESGDRERFMWSENLTWQASNRLSVFGSVSYVKDTLNSLASEFYTDQSTAIVQVSEMDYLTAQLTGMYLLNDTTDITLTATTLLSDNYTDNSSVSVPYGNDLEEFTLSASVAKWLDANKRITLKYSYYDYTDATASGASDFEAHVVTAQYEYHF